MIFSHLQILTYAEMELNLEDIFQNALAPVEMCQDDQGITGDFIKELKILANNIPVSNHLMAVLYKKNYVVPIFTVYLALRHPGSSTAGSAWFKCCLAKISSDHLLHFLETCLCDNPVIILIKPICHFLDHLSMRCGRQNNLLILLLKSNTLQLAHLHN